MGFGDVIDTVLEISVVGSFSSIGYDLRRRLYGWPEPSTDALAGRTVLITGPTSGLGLATARACARIGARVILAGRTEHRLVALRDELTAAGDERPDYVLVDMSSLQSVRAAVDQVRERESRLDVLIDNAGAIHQQRHVTADGLEATFATTVVGPFVMAQGLLPLLSGAPAGRVISTVSGGMYAQALPLDDLQFGQGTFDGTRAYARAKRAQTVMIREWARRLGSGGVRFNAMHPGWTDTPGLKASLPGFHRLMQPILRTPEEGIDTILWLAADADAGIPGGQIFHDRKARPFDRVPATRSDAVERRRLWDEVVALSGADDPSLV